MPDRATDRDRIPAKADGSPVSTRCGTAARVTALFGVLLVLGGWAGLAYVSFLDYHREIARIRSENGFAAVALEEHVRRVVRTADTALRFLKDGFEKRGAVTEDMKHFALLTKADLQAIQVGMSDAGGDFLYSAFPYKAPFNIFEREHFQAQLRRGDAGLYVAKPIRSKATGGWVFFLSRRLNRPDGAFAGIAAIGIDPVYFGKVYGRLGVGEERSGLVVGNDHIVRVRISRNIQAVGDDISGYSPVFREARRAPAGDYEFSRDPKGRKRMASYRVMPDYPLVVIVSIGKAEALAAWRNRTLVNALATVLFSAFVAGFCHFLIRAQRLARRSEEEARALQDRLVQSQKMEAIGTLAGGVAHDFNNMLGVILGRTELALGQAGLPGPLRDNLEEIGRAAQRSAAVTRQLLAFARKQTVAPRVLDLNECVESVLRMIRRLIGEEIDLSWNPGRHLRKVRIDPSQVDQLMANLATNARDAIGGVGRITIETANVALDGGGCLGHAGSSPGEYVVLTVSDDGCGIPRERLKSIFDPFFTTKEPGKGTGLGLATVYGIAKQNDGFVEVDSAPGEGATFRVWFPAAEAADEALPPACPPVPETPGGSETILLVEDEPSSLAMVREMLETFGYRVLASESPSGAIRLAESDPGGIDLLLTDVVMPGMDGRALRDALAGRRPGLRTLFMSGYTSDAIAHRGVLDEGVHFLQKPFSRLELGRKVREVLDGGA